MQRTDSHSRVCCICFSNTLKPPQGSGGILSVFVVFVLAIPSNSTKSYQIINAVFVVFVLAIPSNSASLQPSCPRVFVVFVLAIPSNENGLAVVV